MNSTAAMVTGIRFAQDQTRQSSNIDGSVIFMCHTILRSWWQWIGAGGGGRSLVFEDVATVGFLVLHTCMHIGQHYQDLIGCLKQKGEI